MNTASLPRAVAVLGFALASALACGGTAAPAVSHSTIVVGQDNAGKTVDAKVGDTVRIKLTEEFPFPGQSLTWDVSSSRPTLLKLEKVTRDPADRPRQGNVAYTADFAASASGSADLIARGSRTCEAMAGPGCQNVNFTVTIKIG
jgi:hypothetical protein